jgi:hypothetical protein
MLRSFFDRAADQTPSTTTVTADQWLITPLPCLTSINSTQRSMIEDPNENLLIEQPGAFMKPINSNEQPKQATVRRSYSCIVKSTAEKRKIEQPKQQPTAPPAIRKSAVAVDVTVATKPVVVIAKQIIEEEAPFEPIILPIPQEAEPEMREVESRTSSVVTSQASSPQMVPRSKKDVKKNKKINNNKENKENSNSQVKILLMNDMKKSTSTQRVADLLFSCNNKQMKRNNKNMNLSQGSSLKQRKYHNLQQPSFTNASNY